MIRSILVLLSFHSDGSLEHAALIADRNRIAGVNHNIVPCRAASIVADVVI
jgi:hypothetical protein